MCGFAGFTTFAPFEKRQATVTLRAMCDSIRHRGPDGEGLFVDADRGVALGHRRLSIVDLSETGNQPMESPGGRFCAIFNGEIYGYLSIRQELLAKGISFRGTSDTEVLLAALETWGVQAALERLNGMYAFAILDRQTNHMIFARDRLGKKPLYLGLQNGTLFFGSELKALRTHDDFAVAEVDQEALGQFVRYGYIPAPRTIYRGVVKLTAGTFLEVDLSRPPASAEQLAHSSRRFWSCEDVAANGLASPYRDDQTALNAIEDALTVAVAERMIADVPVGTFLSGGIDSTLVATIMQSLSDTPVTSFTVRFDDEATNEADFAAAIARHIGTDHHEVTATPKMALDLMDQLPHVYDEPFADPSQVPTLLVSQLARSHLKVAMSGDGGDESFGGYARYPRMMLFEKLGRKMPRGLARTLANAPIGLVNVLTTVLHPFAPGRLRGELSADRLSKLASIISHREFRQRYDSFCSLWDPEDVLSGKVNERSAFLSQVLPGNLGRADEMMLLDSLIYLPEDILVKVDRASMSVGLEARAPLLDHRVVSAAWRSPASLRFDGKRGKVALHRLLEKRLPTSLFDRPKQGFGIPVNDWLRGPLKDRAAAMFEGDSGLNRYFDPSELRQRWNEHLSGERNWGAHLWSAMMFGCWHETWMQPMPNVASQTPALQGSAHPS
ncbi:MAG: asparagine synthase (glutamine-hydrolyzing) [Ruegeria sp.]|uniref:asparagine synthase (glutamine-hydrolyzing) n=1 Tax=Ruegeria sp. TaxID=1879320 RepID=UPI00349E4F20